MHIAHDSSLVGLSSLVTAPQSTLSSMPFIQPAKDNPTIVITECNELEDQMLKNHAALGLENVAHANSISALNKHLHRKQQTHYL